MVCAHATLWITCVWNAATPGQRKEDLLLAEIGEIKKIHSNKI